MSKEISEEMLKLHLLGKSTISKGSSMHLPTRVVQNGNIKEGDILEWYPPDTDLPEACVKDCMIVRVRRKSNGSKKIV